VGERVREEFQRHDPAGAARLGRSQAPPRIPARNPSVVFEHELPRAGGDSQARHRPIGGAPAARADHRPARPHGDEVRAG
jgi:hypothetical protein